MKGIFVAGVLAAGLGAGPALAQQQPAPYFVGNPLGFPTNPAADGTFNPISSNTKTYGAIYSAESCAYDPVRDLIVVPNRGVGQAVQANNAWISLLNHDGSIHTPRWIGVQNPGGARANLDPPLVLNEPFGSHIANGILYLADRDGGTPDPEGQGNVPSISVVRMFEMATGRPAGEIRVEGNGGFNDITVAADGVVYGTNTGGQDPATWQVWRVAPDGAASVLIQGEPLRQPNGIAIDPEGNLVVVNIGDDQVNTFSPAGVLLRTERAAQPGSDGIEIMADGTKYVSSVTQGGISMIRPGQAAVLIAENIPSAASMCYDAGANQLVVPMNAHNALTFVPLD